MSALEVEFFFDVVSPYSYLAATQMAGLAERTCARIRWRPFFLGGVMRATGNSPPAQVAAKAQWMMGDLTRWAEHYGVPIRLPSRFPIGTLPAQRALTAAIRIAGEEAVPPFALGLFRAYWVEDRDIGDVGEITAVAAAAGLDAAAIGASLGEQETKDALRATTDEAVSRGAFGAPTFFVGSQMFWGNDRLHFVEAALGGAPP